MKHVAIKAAIEGGKILKSKFGKIKNIHLKGGNYRNFLTQADLQSEKKIISTIKKNFPNHKIISEESYSKQTIKNPNDFYWIVDPLDGTSSFVNKNFYFGISIALYKNNQPIVGVIYNPLTNELFSAEQGKGAYLNKTIKLKCSNINSIMQSTIGMGWASSSRYFRLKGLKTFYNLGLIAKKIDKGGSCTSTLSGVAYKRFDTAIMAGGYLWDVAAADLIIREAGGEFTTLEGKKINLNYKQKLVIASANKKLHQKILNKIKSC